MSSSSSGSGGISGSSGSDGIDARREEALCIADAACQEITINFWAAWKQFVHPEKRCGWTVRPFFRPSRIVFCAWAAFTSKRPAGRKGWTYR